MKTIEVPTGVPGPNRVTARFQLSSNAVRPMMRIYNQGGSMIDPRDPDSLAVLPVCANLEMDLAQAKAYRAALDEFIELLESEQDNEAYLATGSIDEAYGELSRIATQARAEQAQAIASGVPVIFAQQATYDDEHVCSRHMKVLVDNGSSWECGYGCEYDSVN